ncbi:MAG TPA: site-specific integrase [Pirellulales bacterium]
MIPLINHMPNKRKNERIVGQYFNWLLYERDGVYQADGRANKPSAARHSLGTKTYQEALEAIKRLDVIKAVELGLADRDLLRAAESELVPLGVGVQFYLAHVQRPRVTGGARPATPKRYRAVFDKFLPHVRKEGYRYWNQITPRQLHNYAAWLDGEGYAYRTEFLELTTIKQAVQWMINAGHLPASCAIKLPLPKPSGTDTYCWQPDQVTAMIAYSYSVEELGWLATVLTALACTGMRISELRSLRWSDVDMSNNFISLTDESTSRHRRRGKPRQIKNHRSRSFPIDATLHQVLQGMSHDSDGLVFHGPKRGLLSPDIVRRTLIRDVLTPLSRQFPTTGAFGFIDGRLHSFRHYFCSACANSGVPEPVVMQWLGHQQSGMVRHYYHLHDREAQQQMQKVSFVGAVGRRVDGDVNPPSSQEIAQTKSTSEEIEAVATEGRELAVD